MEAVDAIPVSKEVKEVLLDLPPRVPAVVLQRATSRALEMKWYPSIFTHNCSTIQYYLVLWKEKDLVDINNSPLLTGTGRGTDTDYDMAKVAADWGSQKFPEEDGVIQGLVPATEYIVVITSRSRVGFGPISRINSYRTKEDVPDKPGQPLLVSSTPTSVTLCWPNSLRDNGKPIVGWEIQRCQTERQKEEESEGPIERLWEAEAVKQVDNTYQITGLPEHSNWIFKVRARNELGLGEASEESAVIETDEAIKILDVRHDTVEISWSCHPLKKTVRFELQTAVTDQLISQRLNYLTVANNILDAKYELQGLRPATSYKFRVRACEEGAGWQSWDSQLILEGPKVETLNYRPDPPSAPFVIPDSVHGTSAVLEWRYNSCNGVPIIECELQCSYKPGEWESLGVQRENIYYLHNLSAGRTYFYKVRARNSLGWSQWSEESVCLQLNFLSAPNPPEFVKSNMNSIEIRFSPNDGLFIQKYELRFRRYDRWEQYQGGGEYELWQMCESPFSGSPYTVYDLRPCSRYCFQIRVLTVLGWSRWSIASDEMQTKKRY